MKINWNILSIVVVLSLDLCGALRAQDEKTNKPEIDLKSISTVIREDFEADAGPPDFFNVERWRKLGGSVRSEGGTAVCKTSTRPPGGPEGPDPEMIFSGFATKEKAFHPSLTGINYAEFELVDYRRDKVTYNVWLDMYRMGSAFMDPLGGKLNMRCSLTIGNATGQIQQIVKGRDDKSIQLWIDWWSRRGTVVFIGRNLQPDDKSNYPKLNLRKTPSDEIGKEPFIAGKCVILAAKCFARDTFDPLGHRYGLGLADDGETLFWTLDGEVMNSVDLDGFLTADPEMFKDGAYVSLGGLSSYRSNVWKYDNVKIGVSK